MRVELEGQHDLFRGLGKFSEEVLEYASEGLEKAGMNIISDSISNLRKNGSWATGYLQSTGRCQKVNGGYDVGFMGERANHYAAYVEFGSKAHRISYKWLWVWVSKKFHLPNPDNNQDVHRIAYFIKMRIAEQGTRPHPFFVPAVKAQEQNIGETLGKAIKKVIEKYS